MKDWKAAEKDNLTLIACLCYTMIVNTDITQYNKEAICKELERRGIIEDAELLHKMIK